MSNLVAFLDGGSQGNPGPSGVGLVIDGSADGTVRIKKWIGRQDNNVAEYVALLEALQFALEFGAKAAPRIFRFRSRSQADDRRIHLLQLPALFSPLDLPKNGEFS
jgi:hypothetical protein